MYGTKCNERHVSAYIGKNGNIIPDQIIPAGYSGLIYGCIYRKSDGMEMSEEDFWTQPPDAYARFVYPLEVDMDMGEYLYLLVCQHIHNHIGYGYHPHYNCQVESNVGSGFLIDFFQPEKVRRIPNIEFSHYSEEFYIEFSGDGSETGTQEDDENDEY